MVLHPIEKYGRKLFQGKIIMSELTNILKVTPAMIRTLGIKPISRGSKITEAKYKLSMVQDLIASRNPQLKEIWPMDRYLTPKETARSIGVLVATLANWRSQGRGPIYVVISKRCIRYRPEDITLWLHQENEPNSKTIENVVVKTGNSTTGGSSDKKTDNPEENTSEMNYQQFIDKYG